VALVGTPALILSVTHHADRGHDAQMPIRRKAILETIEVLSQ
jgi:hypothetical protein